MEQTFYQYGVEYLRWTDEKGNTWEAVKEQVDVYGKECFEMDPNDDYIIDWNRNHPFKGNMPEWI